MLLRILIPAVVLGLVAMGAVPPTPGPLPAAPPVAPAIDLAQATATIDRLIDGDLARRKVAPSPAISDEAFLRRACLTIIGRIPTAEETKAFVDDAAPDRRNRLIDRLLASPGRQHQDLGWWMDLLRVSQRLGDRYPGHAYIDWLRTAVAENRPYDHVVRDLLTASGQALEQGNGRTGFYLRDAGMPLDHLSATVQAFLGTRIGCAQCHDHPFDVWTRHQFHSLAAYTANTSIVRDPPPGLRQQAKAEALDVRLALRNISNSVFLQVKAPAKNVLPLPADYQYDDAKPKSPVTAAPLWGQAAPVAKGTDPRQSFSDWMTKGNPRFTTAVVNRQWKRFFGRALIDPVDNLTEKSTAENPALLAYLEQVMEAVGYDLVRFEGIVLKTKAWQRTSLILEPGAPWAGEAPVRQRLRAEAWWDSLMALTVPDIDLRVGERAEPLYRFYQEHRNDSTDQLMTLAKTMAGYRAEAKELNRKGLELQERIAKATPEEAKELRRQRQVLSVEREDLQRRSEPSRMLTKRAGFDGRDRFLRAAELPQPAGPDHPLRILGQSDRELIDNGSVEPTIPQALLMMNGIVDRDLTRGTSPLVSALRAAPNDEARITTLWWLVLTRSPTDQERAMARELLASAKTTTFGKEGITAGWKDLIWAVINSIEFRVVP